MNKKLLLVLFLISVCLFVGAFRLKDRLSQPTLAPESERVIAAQASLPFQVLIPAYLPSSFDRAHLEIQASQLSPQGQPAIQLAYPTRKGGALVLREWAQIPQSPAQPTPEQTMPDGRLCRCGCWLRDPSSITATPTNAEEVWVDVGSVHVAISGTAAGLLTYEELRAVLDTLGPAANQLVYSILAEVPVAASLPPAVEIPLSPSGIQEVNLVVTPQGYTPAHFAVLKGVPVRLTFRQLGEVGCGVDLLFKWGDRHTATLHLASSDDQQTLEFTPDQEGDFAFNCPHIIYRGVLTVTP